MNDQRAKVEWRDGKTPVSTRFDDPYFSLENGLAETTHVFLNGNGLPARFCDGFHIAELGFGTGLNMLGAEHIFRQSGAGGKLHFTSFEAFPMAHADMAQALQHFPQLDAAPLLAAWKSGEYAFETDTLSANIVIGDARQTLPLWRGFADAWFLDGFSPAKNPQMWGADLMSQVGQHTAPQGTFATYTAAGFVRRGLSEAGFTVTRCAGFGSKRHMSTGIRQ